MGANQTSPHEVIRIVCVTVFMCAYACVIGVPCNKGRQLPWHASSVSLQQATNTHFCTPTHISTVSLLVPWCTCSVCHFIQQLRSTWACRVFFNFFIQYTKSCDNTSHKRVFQTLTVCVWVCVLVHVTFPQYLLIVSSVEKSIFRLSTRTAPPKNILWPTAAPDSPYHQSLKTYHKALYLDPFSSQSKFSPPCSSRPCTPLPVAFSLPRCFTALNHVCRVYWSLNSIGHLLVTLNKICGVEMGL